MKPGDGEARRPELEPAIREAVEAAHRSDAPPPFARLWRAGRVEPRRRRWLALSAAAAAAAATALAVVFTGPGPASRRVPELPAWTSPTDFLLEVRGLDFLKNAPALRPPPPVAGVADPLKGVLP